jgi:putative addiction module killer protein
MLDVLKSATFESWFDSLRDRKAQARINARIRRLSLGDPVDVKPVGSGVSELRVDYGPGCRVYFMQRGDILAVLLCGGDKRKQDAGRRHQTGDQDCEGLEGVMYGH